MYEFLYGDLTEKIIHTFCDVFYQLRARRGYDENYLRQVLAIRLREQGLHVTEEVTINYRYGGQPIGSGRIDLVVENKIVVELKNTSRVYSREIEKVEAYLIEGGYPVGLLLNFGGNKPFIRRRDNPQAVGYR